MDKEEFIKELEKTGLEIIARSYKIGAGLIMTGLNLWFDNMDAWLQFCIDCNKVFIPK